MQKKSGKGNPWHDKLGRFCHGPDAEVDTWGNSISDEQRQEAVLCSCGKKIKKTEIDLLKKKYDIPYKVEKGNIHFGLKSESTSYYIRCGGFNKNEIEKIKNKNSIETQFVDKPDGGVWFSASNAKFSWDDWVKREGMIGWNKNPTTVKINGAKIVHIYDIETIDKLPKTAAGQIDFEKISEDFDGIELHLSEGKSGLNSRFYGWDCDSTLIFNSEVF